MSVDAHAMLRSEIPSIPVVPSSWSSAAVDENAIFRTHVSSALAENDTVGGGGKMVIDAGGYASQTSVYGGGTLFVVSGRSGKSAKFLQLPDRLGRRTKQRD